MPFHTSFERSPSLPSPNSAANTLLHIKYWSEQRSTEQWNVTAANKLLNLPNIIGAQPPPSPTSVSCLKRAKLDEPVCRRKSSRSMSSTESHGSPNLLLLIGRRERYLNQSNSQAQRSTIDKATKTRSYHSSGQTEASSITLPASLSPPKPPHRLGTKRVRFDLPDPSPDEPSVNFQPQQQSQGNTQPPPKPPNQVSKPSSRPYVPNPQFGKKGTIYHHHHHHQAANNGIKTPVTPQLPRLQIGIYRGAPPGDNGGEGDAEYDAFLARERKRWAPSCRQDSHGKQSCAGGRGGAVGNESVEEEPGDDDAGDATPTGAMNGTRSRKQALVEPADAEWRRRNGFKDF